MWFFLLFFSFSVQDLDQNSRQSLAILIYLTQLYWKLLTKTVFVVNVSGIFYIVKLNSLQTLNVSDTENLGGEGRGMCWNPKSEGAHSDLGRIWMWQSFYQCIWQHNPLFVDCCQTAGCVIVISVCQMSYCHMQSHILLKTFTRKAAELQLCLFCFFSSTF